MPSRDSSSRDFVALGDPGHWLAGSLAVADDKPPPNVVLIIADDMAWTDYGFMGHPQIRTPRLDRLASQSLTFRRGYVTTSLCSPSLASILTGRYPHQHRITSNDPPLPPGMDEAAARRDPRFLAARQEMIKAFDDMPTLPRLLAPKGYLSFQAGKWWGGSYKRGGFTHGMTHGDPARGGRHGDAGLAIGRQGIRPVTLFIELAPARKAPFFVWYAPMMPHQPHNPPERLLDHYRDKAPTEQVAKYWAMCEWFDETCGELLDFLDAKKLADNTLVDLPRRQRLDPGPPGQPLRTAVEAVAVRRRAPHPDPGPMARQGRAPDVRHPRQLDRHRAHDPQGRRRRAPGRAWRASTCWTTRPSPAIPPSSARSSPTTPSTSTTRPRASAIAGSSPATGS